MKYTKASFKVGDYEIEIYEDYKNTLISVKDGDYKIVSILSGKDKKQIYDAIRPNNT